MLQIALSESGGISAQLYAHTYFDLVKLLATCASGSSKVAEDLLQAGISATLKSMLAR